MAKLKKTKTDWRTGKTEEEIAAIIKKRTRTAKRNRKKKAKLLAGEVAAPAKTNNARKARQTKPLTIDRTDRYYVTIVFKGNYTQYTYLTDIPGIMKDDKVVVKTPNGHLEIVTVVSTSLRKPGADSYIMKWIVDKIDLEAHTIRQKIEARKSLLKTRIIQRAKDMELAQDVNTLGVYDPELADLERKWAELA